ncbi:MAG: enoyl-CoA hydratase/isomerase family protein [Chloroflexi bacterium]|nr:enoyl-CoA hydratase/isomerase family protein [Chloroflexota bacterium]
MPNYESILYEKQRGGVLITLNRPEALNAISRAMEDDLHLALDEAERDPEIRAIVLTGAGRAFSSGYDQGGGSGRRRDLVWPYGVPEGMSAAEFLDSWFSDNSRFLHLWELTKPVISAVNGWCMGGGSWYALFSHMTYASEAAVFAQPEVRHGSNTSFIWVLNAGYKNALRYSLVGDHVDAQEALRIGLVNGVFPQAALIEECFKIVERIALVSPETVKINLQIATMGLDMMGLRNAIKFDGVLSVPAHVMLREEFRRPLDEARQTQGIRGYLQLRDGPFQPEPFGPRARRTDSA